jgi:predicted aconitase with swiveling domain
MRGRVLFDGPAQGRAMVLAEPLSLWGGLDPETGQVIDAQHPARGEDLTGRVLVMPSGRGSSSSSSVLAEAVRTGHAPAAILLGEPDSILAVGAAVAAELYGTRVPVLVLDPSSRSAIGEGALVIVSEGGGVSTA